MEVELVNKISNLTFGAYYNESIDRVVVHFFNNEEKKPDIIAYLLPNKAWDIREVVDETSELDSTPPFLGETITITHEQLGIYSEDRDWETGRQ